MLITIDVGNTHICVGVFQGTRLTREFRLATNRRATSDELGLLLSGLLKNGQANEDWEGAVLSSVVPELDNGITTAVRESFGLALLNISPEMSLPVKNGYHPPGDVGPDRLMNAVAAGEEFGTPVIIVDFGTAITIDAVNARRVYRGGAIMPGLSLSADALARGTSLLPRVELTPSVQALGRTTEKSLQAGIFLGAAGAINHLVKKIKKELGANAKVVATGGLAPLVLPHCREIKYFRPHLTLEGLRLTWHYQLRRSGKA